MSGKSNTDCCRMKTVTTEQCDINCVRGYVNLSSISYLFSSLSYYRQNIHPLRLNQNTFIKINRGEKTEMLMKLYWLYQDVGAESHCCRSQWSSSSSWRHFGSCSRRPGPSSQRVTGKTWPSPPSPQSTSQNSSRRRLRSSHRCGWCTAGTRTSDLKCITQDD